MKFRILVILGVVVVLAAAAVPAVVLSPLGGYPDRATYFEIPKGTGLSQIAHLLERKKLVPSAFLFKWTAILLGKRKSMKSGDYKVQGKISVMALIDILSEGRTLLYRVTVPEGMRMKEIAEMLAASGIGKENAYLSVCRTPQNLAPFGLSETVPTLEGFLYPETYYLSKEMTERQVLEKMIRTFLSRIPDDYGQKAKRAGLDFYQAVILASIIEKETAVPTERKVIASVFHNRLNRNMRLQTDPTVIYGIRDFDGDLTRRHLRERTPYNTYVKKGLPPTPIASPGYESLIAAVEPARTDYLYFVAKGDGTHQFSSNYREHHRAVTQFQKKRRTDYNSF